jgi:NADP-dependent 3-hydroxy acid dehydrogenase YdfG
MTTAADLKGRTAVVTGASSGIGRAIAEALGAAGAHVFLSGRTESALKESVAKIAATGGKAELRVGNVRETGEIQVLVDHAVAQTGRLDIMVNNAGLSHPEAIMDGTPEKWKDMFETNVLALLEGCQASVRAMRTCGATGHVVNISSVAAQRPDSGVYGSTKHAVNAISNTLRKELADDPIQVVTIMPGAIATNFARNFDTEVLTGLVGMSGFDIEVGDGKRIPDEVLEAAQTALSEILATPEDVADAVLYAVSQPARVHIAEIVVRPNKDLDL